MVITMSDFFIPVRGVSCNEILPQRRFQNRFVSIPARGVSCNLMELHILTLTIVSIPARGVSCNPCWTQAGSHNYSFNPRKGCELQQTKALVTPYDLGFQSPQGVWVATLWVSSSTSPITVSIPARGVSCNPRQGACRHRKVGFNPRKGGELQPDVFDKVQTMMTFQSP